MKKEGILDDLKAVENSDYGVITRHKRPTLTECERLWMVISLI